MNMQTYKSVAFKANQALSAGIYQHYKGKYYLVLFVCEHTETSEELVIYQSLYDDFKITARPLTMFLENSIFNGIAQPRFKYVADSNQIEKFIETGKSHV